MKKPRKTFLISFNKCGTSTFHNFMTTNGYECVHHKVGSKNLLKSIFKNINNNLDPLHGFNQDSFCDISYLDNNTFIEFPLVFDNILDSYPEAYYIFFDRPLTDWLKSRTNHTGPAGKMIDRCRNAYGYNTNQEVIDRWTNDYHEFKNKVMLMLGDKSNFLYYDLYNDSPIKIKEFLSEYKIDIKKWAKKNVTPKK